MVCKQVTIYITYIVFQIIVSICLLGSIAIPSLVDLLGPLIGIGVIHLLCKRKSFTIASVLVGLTVSVGVLTDLLCFSNLKCCRWLRGKTVEGLDGDDKKKKNRNTGKNTGKNTGTNTGKNTGKNTVVETRIDNEQRENQRTEQAKKESEAAARQADAAAKKAARAAIRYKELSMERARQQKDLSSPNRKRRILFDTDSKRLYRNQQKQINQYGTSSGMNDSDQYAPQWDDSEYGDN